MTNFPLTAAQIEAASGYDLIMALESFWRANGLRIQNLTDGERKAEALHWAAKRADHESLQAFGFTVAERTQFDHCRALVVRQDISDAERRTALRRLAALRALSQKRVFG